MKNKYDVVIIGGGTAGVSCAYISAQKGLSVLLVEKNSFLGGSITSSLVIPAMKTSDNSINNDFFNILYQELYKINGAITYSDGNRGWFNPELTKITLDNLLLSVGVDIMYESTIIGYNKKDNKISSICIDSIYNNNNLSNNEILLPHIEARYYVDATGDGNFCKKINCKFLENLENEMQPINLRFIMSGVDYEKFAKWLLDYDVNRDVTSCTVINRNIYLSTAYTWDSNSTWALKPIVERAIADGIVTNEDMNYFQLFSVAGAPSSIAFNAPRLLNVDNHSKAYIEGRAAIYRLSEFCKKYLIGFEHAYISSIANTLGVRVSNRIQGKYTYTINDLLEGKTFKTPVLISNYPIDIHSKEKDKSTLQKVYKEYQLPIECLMSDDYENVYMIGRCISADFKSQAALRIIPSCFSMGEGLAKYLALA